MSGIQHLCLCVSQLPVIPAQLKWPINTSVSRNSCILPPSLPPSPTHSHMCMCLQRPMVSIGCFLSRFSPYVLRQDLSLKQEFAISARLTCLQAPVNLWKRDYGFCSHTQVLHYWFCLNAGPHDCVAITLVSKPCSFPQIIVFLRNIHGKFYVANYI